MIRLTAALCLSVAFVLFGSPFSRALADDQVPPGNLSGFWRLNHDLSEDPREKMRETRTLRGAPGSGRGGFGGGRRGGGLGGRRARPEGREEEGPGTVDPEALETLRIVHRDPELRVTDGVGREHVLFTDNRKTEEERSLGTVRIRTKWKDGRVVVTTKSQRGPKITETYAVAADGSVLTVVTKIAGQRADVEFRRVYDRVR
jgi:hypothetical protein